MDTLRDLLASLSPSERRYLQLGFKSTSRGDKDSSSRILQALLRGSQGSDLELAKTLKLSPSAFSTRKADLQLKVLDLLVRYDRGRHEKIDLAHELHRARVLGNRGQYGSAYARLSKAEGQAERQDLFDVQIILLNEVLRIFYRHFPRADWETERTRWMARLHQATERMDNLNRYQEQTMLFNEWNSSKSARRSPELLKAVHAAMDDPLLQDVAQAQSRTARYYFYTIQRLSAELHNTHVSELENNRQLAELMLDPDFGPYRGVSPQLMTLALYLDTHARFGDPDDPFFLSCRARVEELLQGVDRNHQRYVHWLLVYHGSKIVLAIRQHQYPVALEATEEAMGDMKAASATLAAGFNRNNLVFLFAASMLLNGKADRTLELLQPVLQENRDVDSLHFHHLCLMLELCAHWNLGNHRYLESRTENLADYLRGLEAPHRFERAFVSHMGSLLRTARHQQYEAFSRFIQALDPLREDLLEEPMFLTVDLVEHLLRPMQAALGTGPEA